MFLPAHPQQQRELNHDGGGHWYYPDGRPLHTVPKKDGSGERNTTRADARTLGLYPSVTTITKVVHNDGLSRWKEKQILDACIASPLEAGENVDSYKAKVRKQSQKKMVDARAFGSLFHEAIDELNKSGFLDSKFDEVKPFVKHYIEWTRDHKVSFVNTEFVCVNKKLGYAGQVDGLAIVDGKLTLLDYKTQDVKPDKKGELSPKVYDSWGWQLAAYKNASWKNKPPRIQQVMNVILCSQTPCYPIIKIWSREELSSAWKIFKASCQVWQMASGKEFDPAANADLIHGNG